MQNQIFVLPPPLFCTVSPSVQVQVQESVESLLLVPLLSLECQIPLVLCRSEQRHLVLDLPLKRWQRVTSLL